MTLTASLSCSEPLLDAKALVANSRASPSNNLFVIFDTFISILFFPEKRREPVLGGLASSSKKTCVSQAKTYNAASGLSVKSPAQTGALCPGIVLIWAAKTRMSAVDDRECSLLDNGVQKRTRRTSTVERDRAVRSGWKTINRRA